jgi:hypothetical protein
LPYRPHIGTLSCSPEIDFASGPYGAFRAAMVDDTQGLAYHLAASFITATNLVVDGAPTKDVQF